MHQDQPPLPSASPEMVSHFVDAIERGFLPNMPPDDHAAVMERLTERQRRLFEQDWRRGWEEAHGIELDPATALTRIRLLAWNCQGAFAEKWKRIAHGADISIIAEGAPIELETDFEAVWQEPLPGSSKYLGVVARDPWRITRIELELPPMPWLLPIRVSGPVDFTVLAVWPIAHEGSYTRQTARVIEEVLPLIDGPVVLAGDLNAPISSTLTQHRRNVDALQRRGLVSAWTAKRGAMADPLTEPTFYMHRRADRPFHIDHVFIPEAWLDGIWVDVGTFDRWVASGDSDHVPVRVHVLHDPNA